MSIPFTQYLMPDGRKTLVQIDMPPQVEEKAREIVRAGFTFECEMLGDRSTISFTITDPEEGDVACELVTNGPKVPPAIEKMVMDFEL